MASVTLTFSQFSPGAKYAHTGVIANGGHLSVSTTVCPSTVLSIVKVPNKSTVIDFWGRVQTGGADQTMQIGTSATRSCILSLLTLSQTFSISTQATNSNYGLFNQGVFRGGGGTGGVITGATTNLLPMKVSLSDDVVPSNVALQANMGVGCSASAFFTFMFLYVCDGMAGRTTNR